MDEIGLQDLGDADKYGSFQCVVLPGSKEEDKEPDPALQAMHGDQEPNNQYHECEVDPDEEENEYSYTYETDVSA
eukprot:11904255-Karenia_brevis.AAC.1